MTQGPHGELQQEMQRQQQEIEILSAELDEALSQVKVLRASRTDLEGSLRARTAELSYKDGIIAE